MDLSKVLSLARAAKMTPLSEAREQIKINATRLAGAIYVHVNDLDEFLKHHHRAK
jgi:hypothetical protein